MTKQVRTFLDLPPKQSFFLSVVSLIIVGFGQPAWSWLLAPLAASVGYALFWRVSLSQSNLVRRFALATIWFSSVQLIQLSWFASHPYSYIFPVYFFFCVGIGLQFGFLTVLVTPHRMQKFSTVVAIASLWTLFEWARLFFLSGFTWNPSGLALTSQLYSLQMASIWGIFGLSFWVFFVNGLALQAWVKGFTVKTVSMWISMAALPFIFGYLHVAFHLQSLEEAKERGETFSAVLVQTAFPAEEALEFTHKGEFVAYVMNEWKQILKITKKHKGKAIDLIVLPEFVVPFGTYSFVYPYDYVKEVFLEILGPDGAAALPPLDLPLAKKMDLAERPNCYFVNNAYWSQAIANFFEAPIVVGLEDAEDIRPGEREYYSAALYFKPQNRPANHLAVLENEYSSWQVERYEKRVLVPMGEYLPFDFCRELAKTYGVEASFTCGKCAKVYMHQKAPFAISICYEETFGDLMREGRQLGAELLVNLTSDVWYPESRLPQQHFDHARLRTVESGIPLLRACNTGITSAIDSLGRLVSSLDEYTEDKQWLADSLYVHIPTYHYATLYSAVGDGFIVGFCFISAFLFFRKEYKG